MQIFVLTFLLFSTVVQSQTDGIPEIPNPPRLVNDFAGFLSADEVQQLERKLVAFDDSSSTQIAVVIVPSLNDYEVQDMAVRIFEKWKIGDAKKNNGVLILIKPKIGNEKGKIAITTGYGMEAVLTDAISKRIIELEIIPSFKGGKNFEGIDNAVKVIMTIARGEFKPDQYMKKKSKNEKVAWPAIIILIVLAVLFFSRGSGGSSRHMSSGGDLPFWMLMGGLLGGMSGGRGGSGGFGDFSGGGGSFGGFGGGSSGGGGASGSW